MVNYNHIKSAHKRISNFIHETPIFSSHNINTKTSADLFFKCDNFQKTGSFKIRGAVNTILQLSKKELASGIITTSSGNHGAAVSAAAKKLGANVTIIMPDNTPKVKVDNVRRYGGDIIFCEPNIKAREDTLRKIVNNTGSTIVHPYNDERIMAGQGTCAKEMLEDIPTLDIIVSPVSGGGLLSGTLVASKNMKNSIKVFGAEPDEADDAFQSLKHGKIIPNKTINTVCDGLRAEIGSKTFPVIQDLVDGIETVSEKDILESLRMIWERMKIIVEPSCSISLAMVIKNSNLFKNKNVGLIMSGGNVNLNSLLW